MNFNEAEDYLLSLGNEVLAMKLGLENIRQLLAALGDPHNKYKKVQVAGTNGKGSVCAFLDSICLSARIKTGLYTSPHLVSITERVRIDGADISEEDFARIATRVRETAEALVSTGELAATPTFFEQVTAIALMAFAEANVELAILETGLGGRLDATTAANAEIAAITQIDFDHQEYLGNTLAEIAAEKAAIIRRESIVVIGEQRPEAMAVLHNVCSGFGISPRLTRDVVLSEPGAAPTGFFEGTGKEAHSLPVVFPPALHVSFKTNAAQYENVRVGLLGRHQIENGRIAILLAETLQSDFDISAKNIIDGLENARHPGRLEYHGKYLFDGAHNVAGVKALAEYLNEFVKKPITLVFGAMKGKDIGRMAEIIFPVADKVILTRPENSRAMTADELATFALPENTGIGVMRTGSVDDALKLANEVTPEDGLILVTGSLYLVGEVKKLMNN